MAIREIYGSIGKEMINGKFYSIPEEQYNQIFGKKTKKKCGQSKKTSSRGQKTS